eukprot:1064122-Rhodomonas_salina.1
MPRKVSTVCSTPTVPRSLPAISLSSFSSSCTRARYCPMYGSTIPVTASTPPHTHTQPCRGSTKLQAATCPVDARPREPGKEPVVARRAQPIVVRDAGGRDDLDGDRIRGVDGARIRSVPRAPGSLEKLRRWRGALGVDVGGRRVEGHDGPVRLAELPDAARRQLHRRVPGR